MRSTSSTLVAALLLTGCSEPSAAPRTTVSVFAASSLTEAFGTLAQRFEAAHPDVEVRLTFAGSQVMRLQIEQGAPADLFASANPAHVEALRAQKIVSASRVFASNALVAITPRGSHLRSFEDLSSAERVVVGTEAVPVGVYTRRAWAALRSQGHTALVRHLEARTVSEESNARLVRAKVELGAADVAFVYRTDAAASSSVRTIELPAGSGGPARYMIGEIGATRPEVRAFAQFVISPQGQRVLAEHGFVTAPEASSLHGSGAAPPAHARRRAPGPSSALGALDRPSHWPRPGRAALLASRPVRSQGGRGESSLWRRSED